MRRLTEYYMKKKETISIFISSTFSDMHRERDLMHQIEGTLNSHLENTEYRITFIDLRSGIDTSAETDEREIERKILSECFSAIDKCQLFIIFLGERYGSIFDESTIQKIPISKEQAFGKSVTHLEFLYSTESIPNENKIVFMRQFQGDRSVLSKAYYDEASGREKLATLKSHILDSGDINYDCFYDASFRNGDFVIDEEIFVKHVTGIIEDKVNQYIRKHFSSKVGILKEIEKEEIHPEIEKLLEVKMKAVDIKAKDLYKRLAVLRTGKWLDKEDHETINKLGANGKIRLEYQKHLVEQLPLDTDELVKYICDVMAKNVKNIEGKSIYRILNLLAYAQHATDLKNGHLSEREIRRVLKDIVDTNISFSEEKTIYYDDYLDNKVENLYASPIRSALSYFYNVGILEHDEYGYGWSDRDSVDLFWKNCSMRDREQLWEYYSDVLWYMPNFIDIYFGLLKQDEFEKFYQCTEKLWSIQELKDRIISYLYSCADKEKLYTHVIELAKWSVEEEKGEIFLTFIFFHLFDSCDLEIFYKIWVPMCQTIYIQYMNKYSNCHRLICKFFLYFLYNEFAVELEESPTCFLTDKETEEMDYLYECVCQMNYEPNFYSAEIYVDALRNIRNYYDEWEDLVAIMQIIALRNGSDSFNVIISLFNDFFHKNLVTETQFQNFLTKYMTAGGCDIEIFLDGEKIEEFNSLIREAFWKDDYNTCLYMLHTFYNSVCIKERIRKAPWLRWIYYLDHKMLLDLYKETEDAILGEILDTMESNFFLEIEELIDFDEECLRRVQEGSGN